MASADRRAKCNAGEAGGGGGEGRGGGEERGLTPAQLAIRPHLIEFIALTGLLVLRIYTVTCCK